MAETYYSILTSIGKAQIANGIGLGTKVDFVKMKVGDGNGTYYNPTESQLDLVHTVWEGPIGHVAVDEDNPNWLNIEVLIPPDVGGFMIREYAVFDANNNMLAIAKCAETYKPLPSDGSTKEINLKMVLAVSNTSSITLKIDPSILFAKKSEVEVVQNQVNTIATEMQNARGTYQNLKARLDAGDTQLSDVVNKEKIYPTTNSGNAYSVTVPNLTTLADLTDGYPLTVKFNAASTGAITVNPNGLGAKNVVDYFGNSVTNVRNKLIANLRYEVSSGNFQLLGKGGGGNAISNDLRLGKNAAVDSGTITGTLDLSNVIPGNIKEGVTIDGVTGTVNIHSLGGYQVGDRLLDSKLLLPATLVKTFTPTALGGTNAIVEDSNGNVYLDIAGIIYKFNSSGTQLWSYNTTDNNTGMRLNPINGNLYIHTTATSGLIRVVSPTGALLNTYTVGGNRIDIDSEGNIYVVTSGASLKKYNISMVLQWTASDTQIKTRLSVNQTDNTIAVIYGLYGVRKYNSSGAIVWTATSASATTATDTITDVVMTKDGNINACSAGMILRKINSSGDVWQYSYNLTYGTIQAICADSDNCVYGVTGGYNIANRIYKWNSSGRLLWTYFMSGGYCGCVSVDPVEEDIYTASNVGAFRVNSRNKIIA